MTAAHLQRLEHANQLLEAGQPREALEEFRALADATRDPIDKAGVLPLIAFRMSQRLARSRNECSQHLQLSVVSCQIEVGELASARGQVLYIAMSTEFDEAEIYRLEGKKKDALAKFGELLSRYGARLRESGHRVFLQNVQVRRAFLLTDLGRWKEALPLLEEVDSSQKPDAKVRFYLGHCYVCADEYGRGRDKLIEALKIGLPEHLEFRAHCALGKAYHKLQSYARAKEELERCAQTADKTYIAEASLWKWLEITCLHLGLKDEAEYYAKLR